MAANQLPETSFTQSWVEQRTVSASRQPELYAATLITYAAAATALVLRMVARRTMRMRLVWEDYMAIVAFVSRSLRA